jgi:SAM-dependent methyltransferase
MKDLFSGHAQAYARFRPAYPEELYAFIRKHVKHTARAWDCATGNGQIAGELSEFFDEVEATDISENQLQQAIQKPNIRYSPQAAEQTNFSAEYFDLVSVGQAVHWFNFEDFNAEVNRVLKPNGLIALVGYSLLKSNAETNAIIEEFYEDIIGPYWDPERIHLEEEYQNIPFPFQEIGTPGLVKNYRWSFEELIGYLNTWSAVKAYQKENKRNPVNLISRELKKAFGEAAEVRFPIIFRLGVKLAG